MQARPFPQSWRIQQQKNFESKLIFKVKFQFNKLLRTNPLALWNLTYFNANFKTKNLKLI